jgi:hypothetical protein
VRLLMFGAPASEHVGVKRRSRPGQWLERSIPAAPSQVDGVLAADECGEVGGGEGPAGRYIGIGRIIEQNKDRYYETLEESSRGWHDGTHDPWPYVNYLLYVLKEAYREFESRVGQTKAGRGEKSEVVLAAINRTAGAFSVADLLRECPGVSVDMIRHFLKSLRGSGAVECLGRGRSARWRRVRRIG